MNANEWTSETLRTILFRCTVIAALGLAGYAVLLREESVSYAALLSLSVATGAKIGAWTFAGALLQRIVHKTAFRKQTIAAFTFFLVGLLLWLPFLFRMWIIHLEVPHVAVQVQVESFFYSAYTFGGFGCSLLLLTVLLIVLWWRGDSDQQVRRRKTEIAIYGLVGIITVIGGGFHYVTSDTAKESSMESKAQHLVSDSAGIPSSSPFLRSAYSETLNVNDDFEADLIAGVPMTLTDHPKYWFWLERYKEGSDSLLGRGLVYKEYVSVTRYDTEEELRTLLRKSPENDDLPTVVRSYVERKIKPPKDRR